SATPRSKTRCGISVWTSRTRYFLLNGPKFEPGAVIRSQRMTASCRLLHAHKIRNGVESGLTGSGDNVGKAAFHRVNELRRQHTHFDPAIVAPLGRLVRTELLRKITPASARACHPQQGVEEAASV